LDVVALEGELLVVMEYVHGESLSRLLRHLRRLNQRIPPAVASAIIGNVLSGLHAAHEATSESGQPLSIIHRDISPQNVMVGADGVARIVDFGVAKAAGRLQETRDGQIKGKVRYMAPEQLKRGDVDRRVDIYATSVVLWECLTGRRLFDDENDWKVASAVFEGVSEPPSTYAPEVSPELDEVVMRGLSLDPARRVQSALEMAALLEIAQPPATPRQVASWLLLLASDAIQKRTEQVAAVESESRPSVLSASFRPPGASISSPTATSDLMREIGFGSGSSSPDLGNLAAGQESLHTEPSRTGVGAMSSLMPRASFAPSRLLVAAAVVVTLALGVILVTLAVRRSSPSATSTSALAAAPPPHPIASEITPEPSAAGTPSTTASAAPAAPSASAEPPAKPRPKATGRVTTRPAPTKGKCNPPYYFDKEGVKHLKAECL
jgi:serine/threonine-protein kinase